MNDVVTVGYIGLGHAGWPMAANVRAAGYELVVRDTPIPSASAPSPSSSTRRSRAEPTRSPVRRSS